MAAEAAQESGNPNAVNRDTGAKGAWQVMPRNWSRWATEAGLDAHAPLTFDNQRTVVRHKLAQYKGAFGEWRNVAIAWYGGPGALHYSAAALDRRQGRYPSINAYADSVMAKACGR